MANSLTLDQIPPPDCSFEEIIKFGNTYHGYRMIASDPESLLALYEPIRTESQRSGSLPYWMGLDLLRGLLFLMVREDHMAGPIMLEPTNTPGVLNMGNLSDEAQKEYEQPFRAVIEAIRQKLTNIKREIAQLQFDDDEPDET